MQSVPIEPAVAEGRDSAPDHLPQRLGVAQILEHHIGLGESVDLIGSGRHGQNSAAMSARTGDVARSIADHDHIPPSRGAVPTHGYRYELGAVFSVVSPHANGA